MTIASRTPGPYDTQISKAIVELVKAGMSLAGAFDSVLGEGSYDVMVSALYAKLNAK
jgi:hypothetical protein